MDDTGEKHPRDEIKVVDDEEVIRLDAPEKKVLGKSGSPAFEEFVPGPSQKEESGGMTPEERGRGQAVPGDEFFAEKGRPQVPMGWFYLLGVGLVGVMVWMGFQIASKDSGNGEESGPAVISGDGAVDEEGEWGKAEEHFLRTEEVVAAFLAADTVEERAKYVRHPERVLPLMRDFHQSRPMKTYQYRKISTSMAYSLESRPFIVLSVVTGEDDYLPVLLEDSPEGILVDWESFVCYQPVSPEKYLEERPTGSVSLRVYATPSNFFAYEFSSEEDYYCFKLTFRKSDVVLYGYTKRGGQVAQKFYDVFKAAKFRQSKPLILKLRFLEGGKADRGVLIEDLESQLWAYPENPAETAE